MPIFMDVHIVPGVNPQAVAEAHSKDIQHQDEHSCKCMTYWIDEIRSSVFCLIEAPTKEAVVEMHNKAHGLIPHKIIEVSTNLVESFLGRIYDPQEAETVNGLKVFHDPSFRILLQTATIDPVLLKFTLGESKANELLDKHNKIIRKKLLQYGGREAEHHGTGFVISFASAAKAVNCALDIQKELTEQQANTLGLKISICSGEPIQNSDRLFGDVIQLGQYMCAIAKYLQVALSSSVKELVAKDHPNGNGSFFTLAPPDEMILQELYSKLEQHWQDPAFDVDDYCQVMAMSKSQLYRKTVTLTGYSPNQLIKEFRLEKAKEMMKKKQFNVSQVTFDSGFTSPSYFTKCFKKKYGLLPMNYMELVN